MCAVLFSSEKNIGARVQEKLLVTMDFRNANLVRSIERLWERRRR